MPNAPVFDIDAVRIKMQDKAKKLGAGGFIKKPAMDPTRLLQKAKGIREEKERESSPRK